VRSLPLLLLSLFAAPAAELPDRDQRHVVVRHTDYEFEMPRFESRSDWTARSAFLKKQILAAAGLLPLPQKTPLNPQGFGRVEHEDYSVEKVLLETYPGYYLGGNLYRPRGGTGPYPAVLTPHGHWRYGRLENSALGSIPARSINLARQGYVVFAYDMVGYNDTRQLPHDFLGGKREQMWGVGILGVQLWNSIRAVDFVESLSDVDPNKIVATGASGGGTQTFLLTAVDDRIAASVPVNMVSGIMQGGSVCENAPNLRIETNNVEIAALSFPRPLLLIAATGDWTRNVPRVEFPAIERIYDLMGRGEAVDVIQFDSPHNYHQGSREAMYAFFGKTILGDDDRTHFMEKSYSPEDPADLMALWNRTYPPNAVDKKTFIEQRIAEAEKRIESLKPLDAASLARAQQAFRETLGYAAMVFEPSPEEIATDPVEQLPNGERFVFGRRGKGERIPGLILQPAKPLATARPTLIVHPEGEAWTLSSSVSREGFVADVLNGGGPVMAIDAFQTGRSIQPRDIAGAGRNAERYFTTFERTDTANRILDITLAISVARSRLGAEEINLVCFGEAGPWCAVARSLASGRVHMVADMNRLDTSSDQALAEDFFIPHFQKAGGFRGASTLWTAGSALAYNVTAAFSADYARASFAAAGAPDSLLLTAEEASRLQILDWLGLPPPKR